LLLLELRRLVGEMNVILHNLRVSFREDNMDFFVALRDRFGVVGDLKVNVLLFSIEIWDLNVVLPLEHTEVF
jgi:hypothetical protein